MRQVIKNVIEKDKILYAAFVDLKTFDSVCREKLWVALKDYGRSLLAAVQSLYKDDWARVRVGGRESTQFQVKSRVR